MQQVNLYLPELQPKKEWLTAQTLVVCTAVYICLMLVTLFAVKADVEDAEMQASFAENAKLASEERLKKYSNMTKSLNVAQIEDDIEYLKREVNYRQQLSKIIQGQNLGNDAGFSPNLESLAKYSFQSIALTHIRLSRGGAFVELQGNTGNPIDIPTYIELLQEDDVFAQARFGAFSISRDKARVLHDFALGFESLYQVAVDE